MTEHIDIAGYCRISVDEELDRDNVSIENQKAIITDFVKHRFPDSTLTFYEDRDRSGYTFEQREGYQAMRHGLMDHRYDVLIVKDFSRFSRRNSRGLVELEDLRDAGVRIISIGDNIDFPNDDDWLKIQFQFLINEMPVTDTSRKVRNVIKRRQNDGEWICAAPYGYLVTEDKQFEIIPTEAETVRRIFDLYSNAGWGYKKIANYLTDQGVPTPRMSERMRKEAAGKKTKREAKNAWAIATVQGILDNDFYIGTLRQGKYTRAKINGKEIKRNDDEHIVIENHHQAIIDYRTCPDNEDPAVFLSNVEKVALEFSHKTVIVLGCGDSYVQLCAHLKDQFPRNVVAPYIDGALLDRLINKEHFYELCDQHGIDHPATFIYDGSMGHDFTLPFGPPYVAKPADSVAYWEHEFEGVKKVFICQTWEELLHALDLVYASGYPDHMVIQEFIPGDDTYMRVMTNYSDRSGQVKLMCLGHVLLEEHSPHGIGNHAVIITEYDEALSLKIKQLLEELHYTGFSNFDIKYSGTPGDYRVFEINLRQGRSNYYVTATGMNIAKLVVEKWNDGGTDCVLNKNEVFWHHVPAQVAFTYTEDKDLVARAKALKAQGKEACSLLYKPDLLWNPVRYACVLEQLRRQFKKFKTYYPVHK